MYSVYVRYFRFKTVISTYALRAALRALTLRSEARLKAALDDAGVWRRVWAAENTIFLSFQNVTIDQPRFSCIMEYCPGGDLSSEK